jgi:peptidyl-prolyl cis-trans isomerase D
MFEFIRSHNRLLMGLLLLLIIPSFVLFGVEGYNQFTDGSNATVARVDGERVRRTEWDLAHRRAVEDIQRRQPGTPAAALDTPEARRATLDSLVRDRMLIAAAADAHLFPTDERLQRLFATDAQFAPLRNADGSINRELLLARGMTSEMFAAQLRQQLGMQQVLAPVVRSVVLPPAAAEAALAATFERREVQLQRFDPAAYAAKVVPTDAELEAYHRANEAAFRTAEQARIEYVVLDLAALAKDMPVPEEDLRRYYEENAARFTTAEERRASHILVKAEAGLPAEARTKARQRAEALLAEVRKSPNAFAEIARRNSDDPGSAAQGGDLGFFGRGAMVKAFDDAVFAMKPGEISNVIESDFGYHVIRLESTRGGVRQPLEEVRSKIEADVRQALAQRRWAEAAEQFTNTVYEQPDSLEPVVTKLKLEVRTTTVQRQPAPGVQGALASPKLLEAVFATDALANKRNTQAIDVGPNQLAAARVLEHQPARVQPLAEVKEGVRQRVIAQQAAAKARADGEARVKALQATGAAAEALPATIVLSRGAPQGAPPSVLDAILRVDPTKLPAVTGIDLGNAGYVVAKVTKVLPREPLPGGEARYVQEVQRRWAEAEAEAYLAALKARLKVEVKEAAVAAAVAAPAP